MARYGTESSFRRAAAFVGLEVVGVVAAAALLRQGGRGIGLEVATFGPIIGLVLLAPALRPTTRAGATCRTFLLLAPIASVAAAVVLSVAIRLGDTGSMYPSSVQYAAMGLYGIWAMLMLPLVGLVCWGLLATAAAHAEHNAFLAAAGTSVAPLVVVWPMAGLEALARGLH